jgi:hypothetical protein
VLFHEWNNRTLAGMRVRRTKGHIRVGRSAVFSRIWTERVISLLLRVIASTMASFIDEYVIEKIDSSDQRAPGEEGGFQILFVG